MDFEQMNDKMLEKNKAILPDEPIIKTHMNS